MSFLELSELIVNIVTAMSLLSATTLLKKRFKLV